MQSMHGLGLPDDFIDYLNLMGYESSDIPKD